MWADNEVTLDLLNVRHLTSATIALVDNNDLAPVTIGVFGDWGSGKSSILRMVHAELEARDDDGILCVWFNGWQFEGYDDAKAALIGTILDDLRTKRGALTNAKEQFVKLLGRVRWLRVMGMAGKGLLRLKLAALTGGLSEAATAAAGAAKESAGELEADDLAGFLAEDPDAGAVPSSVADFRAQFAELLRQAKVTRLVVVIDDLDRCLPDRIVETLEAIKLFLGVPGTTFLIGADEALVRRAVQSSLGVVVDAKDQFGRDYLEKLIQIPVHVPPMSAEETEGYMNLLFAQLRLERGAFEAMCAKRATAAPTLLGQVPFSYPIAQELLAEVPAALGADLAMVSQIGVVLAGGTGGNPRQTKRFLNALLLRLTLAKARNVGLDQRVMAKLMLLEYNRPAAFATLEEWQRDQQGKAAELKQLETAAKARREQEAAGVAREAPAEGAPSEAHVAGQIGGLLDDAWLQRWLGLDPPLGDVDLGPYYYFSKQRGAAAGSPAQRMSPKALEAYDQLQSASEASRIQGRTKAGALGGADAVAVLAALTARISRLRADELGADGSPLLAVFELADERPELKGELLVGLGRISPGILPPQAATRVVRLARGTAHLEAAERLLQAWQGGEASGSLRTAAAAQLPRLREGATPSARRASPQKGG